MCLASVFSLDMYLAVHKPSPCLSAGLLEPHLYLGQMTLWSVPNHLAVSYSHSIPCQEAVYSLSFVTCMLHLWTHPSSSCCLRRGLMTSASIIHGHLLHLACRSIRQEHLPALFTFHFHHPSTFLARTCLVSISYLSSLTCLKLRYPIYFQSHPVLSDLSIVFPISSPLHPIHHNVLSSH